MKALYLPYDGITDPLGKSQVLPYLMVPDRVIEDIAGRVSVEQFDYESLLVAVGVLGLIPIFPARIPWGAERWFWLEPGVAAYDRIYRSLETARAPRR